MNECYKCRDNFEDEAVCYVCYRKLINTIGELRREIRFLREKFNILGTESVSLNGETISAPIERRDSCL